jgi:hypothetical protein
MMDSTAFDPSVGFDWEFRPTSYWGPQGLSTWYGSRVSGEIRRKALLERSELPDELAAEQLSKDLRRAIGRINPVFMGGEYLPKLIPNEVEIARVVLDSTTRDVISVRARHTRHRIKYRIVDEYYGDVPEYPVVPTTSRKPLTLRQLVGMMDHADIVYGHRDRMHFENDFSAEQSIAFVEPSSVFYPDLEKWYAYQNSLWRAEVEQESYCPQMPPDLDTFQSASMAAMGWIVHVDDHAHYMDEDERYTLGTYESYEAAISACKRIVDECLDGYAAETAEDLLRLYSAFGEDPWIEGPNPSGVASYSSWDYAKQRCRELRPKAET